MMHLTKGYHTGLTSEWFQSHTGRHPEPQNLIAGMQDFNSLHGLHKCLMSTWCAANKVYFLWRLDLNITLSIEILRCYSAAHLVQRCPIGWAKQVWKIVNYINPFKLNNVLLAQTMVAIQNCSPKEGFENWCTKLIPVHDGKQGHWVAFYTSQWKTFLIFPVSKQKPQCC